MWTTFAVIAAGLSSEAAGDVTAAPPPPPPPAPLIALSAGFGSGMVLQHSTPVAIYGVVNATGGTPASVQVTVAGGDVYSVAAVVTGSTWKASLRPAPAGHTEYSITVTCVAGCNGAVFRNQTEVVIDRVVYGHVWFCSGQSNMALPLYFTFSRPTLEAAVLAGKYSNIRTFQYGGMSDGPSFYSETPKYVTTDGAAPWWNGSGAAAQPSPVVKGHIQLSPFRSFSATCTYFAVGLVDLGITDPIGLIQAAVGGTQIEAWLDNETLTTCKNESGWNFNASGANVGYGITSKLYYGMVTPFVNRSLAGWIWYQGENNCHGDPGNSLLKTGYGCDQVALVKLWRKMWSTSSGTTPTAPFGVTSLAAGGSEGAGQHMAAIRWSQTGNYGRLPNAAMVNTFLAHAYDIGDPWSSGCGTCNCSHPDPATGKYGPTCVAWDDSAWNPSVKPIAPLVRNDSAPFFMGPIHPRFKHEVGRRLAIAMLQNTSGPTLMGCTATTTTVELRFDPTALTSGEGLVIQPFNTNISEWGNRGDDSSSLMVCSTGSGNATTCGCLGWNYLRVPNPNDPSNPGHDSSLWYCENGPGWKPHLSDERLDRRRRYEAEFGFASHESPDRLGWRPGSNGLLSAWSPAPMTPTTVARDGNSPLAVVVDTSGVNGTVLSVRYGWPFASDTCCPQASITAGLEVCRPASCPIMSDTTNLPLNPFFATLTTDHKCACTAPQVCDQ